MIFWANPGLGNNRNGHGTNVSIVLADLQAHRKSFTAVGYQYYQICGLGSNDPGGSHCLINSSASGPAHLAPIGAPADLASQLRHALGASVELWPLVSYGNPGNASVLNQLLLNKSLSESFAEQLIEEAHRTKITGISASASVSGCLTMCF